MIQKWIINQPILSFHFFHRIFGTFCPEFISIPHHLFIFALIQTKVSFPPPPFPSKSPPPPQTLNANPPSFSSPINRPPAAEWMEWMNEWCPPTPPTVNHPQSFGRRVAVNIFGGIGGKKKGGTRLVGWAFPHPIPFIHSTQFYCNFSSSFNSTFCLFGRIFSSQTLE